MPNKYLLEKIDLRAIESADKFTIFDVGANHGDETLGLSSLNNNIDVHAFEPIPELAEELRNKATGRYFINQCAIDLVPGIKKLGISRAFDMGTSSLNEFKPDVQSLGAWDSNQLKFDEFLDVECIRLDAYCDKLDVTRIDFLKIDCQGHDLIVLRSLGEKLLIVEAGVLEVSRKKENRIYKDGPSRREAVEYLWAKGFKPVISIPNDHKNIEQNLFFEKTSRRGFAWFWIFYMIAVAKGFPDRLGFRIRARLAFRTRLRAFRAKFLHSGNA